MYASCYCFFKKNGIAQEWKRRIWLTCSVDCCDVCLRGAISRSFGCGKGEKDGTSQNMHETSNHTEYLTCLLVSQRKELQPTGYSYPNCVLPSPFFVPSDQSRFQRLLQYCMMGLSFLEMPRPTVCRTVCVRVLLKPRLISLVCLHRMTASKSILGLCLVAKSLSKLHYSYIILNFLSHGWSTKYR